jgi:hypothetical protein
MSQTIFYSWQSDLPNKTNRSFIQEALEKAIREIARDTDLENADRPETENQLELDKDTKGVTGSPPIVETILGKIEKATIFIPDLTFVCSSDKRQTPNPNVLIEYGYALKVLGHSRIIPIMNEAYGKVNEHSLPFDMKHLRWPRTYDLPDNADPDKKKTEMINLVKYLVKEIRQILDIEAQSPSTDPLKGYALAQEILKDEDPDYLWNQSLKSVRKEAKNHLTDLASNINSQASNANMNEILEQALSGVSDWISYAMGGVESRKNPFNQQIPILDDLFIIDGWPRSGDVAVVKIPCLIAHAYQAVLGALYIHSSQVDLCFQLSQTQVADGNIGKRPLIKNGSIFAFPEIIGERTSTQKTTRGAWKFLKALPNKSWPWLIEIFGSKNEYIASLSAYYMTMDVFELICQLKLGKQSHRLVSLDFVSESDEILDQAGHIFNKNRHKIIELADRQGISITRIQQEWSSWRKRAKDINMMLSLPHYPHLYKDLFMVS